MVEEPEIICTGSVNNAEIISTVHPLQETIKGRAYVSRLMQRLGWRGLSGSKTRRRGTDRTLVRSVTTERRRCIASDFESDIVQPNTSFCAELERRNVF
jgi:hypothetical protein